MTDPVPATSNHLRAIAELAGAANHTLSGSVANALEQLNGHGPPDRAVLAAVFDRLQPQLSSLGERTERARWHLDMARGFVAGEPRTGAWTDRYTPTFITLVLVPFKVLGFFLAHKIVAVAVFLLVAAVAAMLVLGWWRARQRRTLRRRGSALTSWSASDEAAAGENGRINLARPHAVFAPQHHARRVGGTAFLLRSSAPWARRKRSPTPRAQMREGVTAGGDTHGVCRSPDPVVDDGGGVRPIDSAARPHRRAC
jgi:hypothetical protein